MKTKDKWKGREKVLNYLKPNLWRMLYKQSQANIQYQLENLMGLTPEELLVLKKINFLLSSEFKELLNILPQLMRNLAHSTRKETIECRGIVRGRIDWGLTIKERYSQGFSDPSLFICKPASKMYDLPENQLLKYILNEIVNFCDDIEFLPKETEEILEESKANDYIETIQTRRSFVRKTLKNVQFHNISLPSVIRPKTIQRTRNHRNRNYRPLVHCYELYENLFLYETRNSLKNLLEKQLLEPLNDDKLYELYILFKVFEKLKLKGGKLSLGLLKPGKKINPFVAQYHDEEETINVYYQKMPGNCWKESEYKDIFRFYDLNVSSRRPDIILEFLEENSYQLIEVKRTSNRNYIVDSVYKVIGYLNDFKKCFPDKKANDGVLVVWKGIKIDDWFGAAKKQIIILSEPNLNKGLNKILSINESSRFEDMKLIEELFNNRFNHWNITLPEGNIIERHSGYIQEAGWLIQYCFGKDEVGEYLDYYAAHRMTNDSHIRIYSDGRKKKLPALNSMRLVSKDPIEDKRLEEEYNEHNRKVVKILTNKGFDKFTINMFLHAGMDNNER